MSEFDRIVRALVWAAYEQGWRNACDDQLQQDCDPKYPIGHGHRSTVDEVLVDLDPNNLIGLRGVS